MTGSLPSSVRSGKHRGANLLALLIFSGALGVLYLNVQPTPAGVDADMAAYDAATLKRSIAPPPPPLPVDRDDADTASAGTQTETPQGTLSGNMASAFSVALLEAGLARLERIPSYTVTFFKQERIDGELTEGQVIKAKIRHQPFSVYMKWLVGDKGREAIYVEGQNEGKMIVHLGGWKARLPALRVDPHGPLAMRESRHPITNAGLRQMAQKLLEHRRRDLLRNGKGVDIRMIGLQNFDERDCYCFVIHYANPDVSPPYRKSIQYIDKEWMVPVYLRNYTWPEQLGLNDVSDEELDEATLLEFYTYSDIDFDQRLADLDFDSSNSAYRFRR